MNSDSSNQITNPETKKFSSRYNLFPIKDFESYSYYVKLEAGFWQAFEMQYVNDIKDYKNLKITDSEGKNAKKKWLIDMILGFFAPADGMVAKNIVLNFLQKAEDFESQLFFTCQLHNEAIHALTYSLIIQTLIPDEKEQNEVLEMVDNLPCTKAKAELIEKYIMVECEDSERYVAFACAEGIFFCVLFTIIFWFRSQGIFHNLIFSNEQISKDESVHRNFACSKYRKCKNKDSKKTLEIVKKFVEVEEMFLKTMLPEPIDDLNYESLNQYLYLVADNLLVELGEETYWNVTNPLTWMEDISIEKKTNFFEQRVGSYRSFSAKDALDIDKLTGRKEVVDVVKDFDKVEF